jgi:hypothetical protein
VVRPEWGAAGILPCRVRGPHRPRPYADAVLHVTIPASPKAQARRVEVTRAAGGSRVVPGGTAESGEVPASSTGGGAG